MNKDAQDSRPQLTVSVIIPSFNQARYIEETLLSVLTQDYSHIEVIVMDGGSTDGSVEIIKKYADRLTYWESKPDRGQSHAINKGYKHCSGEIINWLCSDDVLLDGAITKVVEAFKQDSGAAAVLGGVAYTDENSEILGYEKGRYTGYDDLIQFWNCRTYLPQPSFFMHRNLLQKADYFLDEKHHNAMDYDFWCRTLKGERVIVIDENIGTYRRHEEAKTTASLQWLDDKLSITKRYWGTPFSLKYWKTWYACYVVMCRLWSIKHWDAAVQGRGEGRRLGPLFSLLRSLIWYPAFCWDKKYYSMAISLVLGVKNYDRLKDKLPL